MSRTPSGLLVATLLAGCAQSEVIPPPSLADQLASSQEQRSGAVAVTVGASEEIGAVSVAVARIGPDGVDLTLQTPDGEATTSSLGVGEQARAGSTTVRVVDVAADTAWVVADSGPAEATPSAAEEAG